MMTDYLINLKFKIANYASGFPGLYTFVSKNLTTRDCYTTKETDIVIDGFPRCANTYATYAFKVAQKTDVVIANHIHKKSQFLIAEKYKIPAILLIRHPLDCISSLLIRQPKYNPALLFEGYYLLYSGLRNPESFVIGNFDAVVNNYTAIIQNVNTKFEKKFDLYIKTDENEKAVKSIIQNQDELKAAADYNERVAYPNAKRKEMNSGITKQLLKSKYKKEYSMCEKIYDKILSMDDL